MFPAGGLEAARVGGGVLAAVAAELAETFAARLAWWEGEVR